MKEVRHNATILFTWNSRTVKTKLLRQKGQRGLSLGPSITDGPGGIFWDDRNVLYFCWGGDYTVVKIYVTEYFKLVY